MNRYHYLVNARYLYSFILNAILNYYQSLFHYLWSFVDEFIQSIRMLIVKGDIQ